MTESTSIDGYHGYRIIKFVEINGEDGKDVGVRGFAVSKYPPAKPEALVREPLKAA